MSMTSHPLFARRVITFGAAVSLLFGLAACLPSAATETPATDATAESAAAEPEATAAETDEMPAAEAGATEDITETEATEPEAEAEAVPGPLTITATEFQYDAPARILGGMTEITFVNAGEFAHALVFARLGESKTTDDVLEVLTAENLEIPDWMSFPGGIGGIDPGQSATAFLDLQPGQYAIFSFESSAGDDTPDAAKGMLQAIEVTDLADEQATPPQPDTTIALVDFSFIPIRPIEAGRQVIRFENDGEQAHEALIMRLEEGTTGADVIEMLTQFNAAPPEGAAAEAQGEEEADDEEGAAKEGTPADNEDKDSSGEGEAGEGAPPGPPPFASAGGMTPIDVGTTSYLEMDFEPGEYMFICFIPDPASGAPHFAKGMAQAFTVE